MPFSTPTRPRHRLPAPMTMATCTSISRTSFTRLAISVARSALMPNPSGPPSASPLSLSMIRLYFGCAIPLLPFAKKKPTIWLALLLLFFRLLLGNALLAQRVARKAPDDDVLAHGPNALGQHLLH